ncbi:glycoside hydrolase family 32 protein [Luteococcus peritonei]|uniref:glycoside hydrolase family 32 protein n=1 Tax=Luteococcus peritonei TaxID=88874 RepID=UPI003614289A
MLVHDAEDLTNWPLLGELVTVADPVAAQHAPADIWECPNLVRLGDDWVLVVSLWLDGQLSGVRWLLGDLQLEEQDGNQVPRFSPRTGGVLDTGPCFYAPQLVTHEERTLLIGWSWELERSDEVLAEQGWAGVLTTPRELSVRDGRLVQDLPREVMEAVAERVDPSWRAAEHPCVLVRATSAVVLTCDLAEGESRLELQAGSTVILDGSLVEVFHEGSTRTTRCYPALAATWSVTGQAEVRVLG